MFERFTDTTRKSIIVAHQEARETGTKVGTEHLLIGILEQGTDAATVLAAAEIDADQIRTFTQAQTPEFSTGNGEDPDFSQNAKRALLWVEKEAGKRGFAQITPEMLLLGIIDNRTNKASIILTHLNINFAALERALIEYILTPGKANVFGATEPREPRKSQVLETYGTNLNKLQADPVIGRDEQIRRITVILGRKNKNNPVLIGAPGVGKTAIVEGLAQQIEQEKIKTLKGKQIYSLDLSSVVAGSRYRGDFEDRLKKILKEVQNRTDIILFIDELHLILGAGGAEGAIDASSMLKPLLARRGVQIIGATTLEEYRKIEKDAALERRFQPITVEEPDVDATIGILLGIKEEYENHHGINIDDDAMITAAKLSHRYITDRFLPDKAIDLIDEAGSDLKTTLAEEQTDTPVNTPTPTLTSEMITNLVGTLTKIPVGNLNEDETKKLLNINETLQTKVIGQQNAISKVSETLKRIKTGLKDPNRPGGSFIFAGPTGVGKTSLAKALAEYMFGNQDNLITLDMSEYSEKHTASKLFGAPPGYVGYDEGGQLTEKIRRRPFSVLLLDEIEKAHPDIFNSLLQVLEEGRMTDGAGKEVNFKNTIIIMTTNLGVSRTADHVLGFGDDTTLQNKYEKTILAAVNDHFRPEFINRVDSVVVFNRLEKEDLINILEGQLQTLETNLTEQLVSLTVTGAAKEALVYQVETQAMGARPLRRQITEKLENPIADMIIEGKLVAGDHLIISAENNNITFQTTKTNTLLEQP